MKNTLDKNRYWCVIVICEIQLDCTNIDCNRWRAPVTGTSCRRGSLTRTTTSPWSRSWWSSGPPKTVIASRTSSRKDGESREGIDVWLQHWTVNSDRSWDLTYNLLFRKQERKLCIALPSQVKVLVSWLKNISIECPSIKRPTMMSS